MESILTSVKKLLGIEEAYTHFDPDIIMHINSVFMVLNQLGVGPTNGFRIEDDKDTWSDYMSDEDNIDAVKSYMQLKVKLLFDPPQSSAVMEAMKRMIDEFEFRLNVAVDPGLSKTTS